MSGNRILWEHGRQVLDEVVAHNASVHMERMSDSSYWLGITLGDGTSVDLDIGSVSGRAVVAATVANDDVAWDEDAEHEGPA